MITLVMLGPDRFSSQINVTEIQNRVCYRCFGYLVNEKSSFFLKINIVREKWKIETTNKGHYVLQ